MPGAAIVHRGWLARDPGRLVALLADCAGNPSYDTMQLRRDLDRFIFLLGGGDGGEPFGPAPPECERHGLRR
jgi:hypothetical protein